MSLTTRLHKLEAKTAVVAQALAVQPVAVQTCPRDPVRTPADVVDLLAQQVETLRRDPRIDPLDKARTIALLASITLRAMQVAEDDTRLQAVERVLKLRRDAAREKAREK